MQRFCLICSSFVLLSSGLAQPAHLELSEQPDFTEPPRGDKEEHGEIWHMWATDREWTESEWDAAKGSGFVLSDVYRIYLQGRPQILIVGDGVLSAKPGQKVPFEWEPAPNSIQSDIECVWRDGRRQKTTIETLRDANGAVMSRKGENEAQHFLYIYCDGEAPSERGMPIKLESPSTGWSVDLVKPDNMPVETAGRELHKKDERYAVCLAPLYGTFNNNRWLIEWMEYQRQVGAARVHVYMIETYNQEAMKVLRYYHRLGFVVLHHWEKRAGSENVWKPSFTKKYESGKMMAWNDCFLRERGRVDWLEVADIDEVFYSPIDEGTYSFDKALGFCDEQYQHGKKVCQVASVTMAGAYKPVRAFKDSDKLLMQEFNAHEAEPFCPYNCGRYHKGRQKYFVRCRELHDIPLMLWTHAVGGEDYTMADKITVQMPYMVMHVLHYNAWWYVYLKMLPTLPLLPSSFHNPVIEGIRKSILGNSFIKGEYLAKDFLGLSWVTAADNFTDATIEQNLLRDGRKYAPKLTHVR